MLLEKEMVMEPCLDIDFLSNCLLTNYTEWFFFFPNLVSVEITLAVFIIIVAF